MASTLTDVRGFSEWIIWAWDDEVWSRQSQREGSQNRHLPEALIEVPELARLSVDATTNFYISDAEPSVISEHLRLEVVPGPDHAIDFEHLPYEALSIYQLEGAVPTKSSITSGDEGKAEWYVTFVRDPAEGEYWAVLVNHRNVLGETLEQIEWLGSMNRPGDSDELLKLVRLRPGVYLDYTWDEAFQWSHGDLQIFDNDLAASLAWSDEHPDPNVEPDEQACDEDEDQDNDDKGATSVEH